jgi:hypothetical protein
MTLGHGHVLPNPETQIPLPDIMELLLTACGLIYHTS